MDKYETFEIAMADAQYLREFYDWNKARHPEWDGTYVLEIAKKREERARHIKYEVPIEEYWMKLRDLLRGWWKTYVHTYPEKAWTFDERVEYCYKFLESLKKLNPALQLEEQSAVWVLYLEQYEIFIVNQGYTHAVYLHTAVKYKDEERGKTHNYNTGHLDQDSVIGIIGKEVKNA